MVSLIPVVALIAVFVVMGSVVPRFGSSQRLWLVVLITMILAADFAGIFRIVGGS